MKKLIIPACVILFSLGAKCQLYVGAGCGYGLQLSPSSKGTAFNGSIYSAANKSDGQGILPGFYFGFFAVKNRLAFQLDCNYLYSKITVSSSMPDIGYNSKEIYTANMIRISPSCKIFVGENNLQLYTRFGPVLGLGAHYIDNMIIHDPVKDDDVKTRYYGGIAFGFSAALGGLYHFNEKLSIFAEIGIIAQSWAPKHSEILLYKSIYGDITSTMTTNQKKTDYVNSYDQATVIGPDSPSQALKFYLPFSSWGLNLGIQYSF